MLISSTFPSVSGRFQSRAVSRNQIDIILVIGSGGETGHDFIGDLSGCLRRFASPRGPWTNWKLGADGQQRGRDPTVPPLPSLIGSPPAAVGQRCMAPAVDATSNPPRSFIHLPRAYIMACFHHSIDDLVIFSCRLVVFSTTSVTSVKFACEQSEGLV